MSDKENSKLTWDHLIQEAEERIKTLRSSLKYFKEMKQSGTSFPVDFPAPKREDLYRHIET